MYESMTMGMAAKGDDSVPNQNDDEFWREVEQELAEEVPTVADTPRAKQRARQPGGGGGGHAAA
jgi:hypothetical protein